MFVIEGPRGKLYVPRESFITIDYKTGEVDAPKNELSVRIRDTKDKKQQAMWGTTRTLIDNAVEGVTDGWVVPLKLVGVGYRAILENGKLGLKLGYSHPITLDIPKDIEISIPNPTQIILVGNDLQKVTQFAAQIRKWRPPEPYNQKGIFVGDETIKKKEGKKR